MNLFMTNSLDAIANLGWDCYDNVIVEIGGTSVYEIEGAGTKCTQKRVRLNITKMRSL